MQDNIFDAPIPGESLTDTPGNASWEHPPQFTNVNEAAEHIWDKLHDRNLLQQVITFLEDGIPVEAIARMILFSGFTEGKWTPDVAILLAEVVFKQIMAIGMRAEIPKMKMFMEDQSNNQFHQAFAKFNIKKQKAKETSTEEAKEFAEEIKKEITSSGLMAKEIE